ncbi:hypothetical protein HDU76_008413 [Blyttiomyces sp. JEL0837]|nr:hypothetical protein HDU76_008413 [Blyttiomyces sp. JEL0837]
MPVVLPSSLLSKILSMTPSTTTTLFQPQPSPNPTNITIDTCCFTSTSKQKSEWIWWLNVSVTALYEISDTAASTTDIVDTITVPVPEFKYTFHLDLPDTGYFSYSGPIAITPDGNPAACISSLVHGQDNTTLTWACTSPKVNFLIDASTASQDSTPPTISSLQAGQSVSCKHGDVCPATSQRDQGSSRSNANDYDNSKSNNVMSFISSTTGILVLAIVGGGLIAVVVFVVLKCRKKENCKAGVGIGKNGGHAGDVDHVSVMSDIRNGESTARAKNDRLPRRNIDISESTNSQRAGSPVVTSYNHQSMTTPNKSSHSHEPSQLKSTSKPYASHQQPKQSHQQPKRREQQAQLQTQNNAIINTRAHSSLLHNHSSPSSHHQLLIPPPTITTSSNPTTRDIRTTRSPESTTSSSILSFESSSHISSSPLMQSIRQRDQIYIPANSRMNMNMNTNLAKPIANNMTNSSSQYPKLKNKTLLNPMLNNTK